MNGTPWTRHIRVVRRPGMVGEALQSCDASSCDPGGSDPTRPINRVRPQGLARIAGAHRTPGTLRRP